MPPGWVLKSGHQRDRNHWASKLAAKKGRLHYLMVARICEPVLPWEKLYSTDPECEMAGSRQCIVEHVTTCRSLVRHKILWGILISTRVLLWCYLQLPVNKLCQNSSPYGPWGGPSRIGVNLKGKAWDTGIHRIYWAIWQC